MDMLPPGVGFFPSEEILVSYYLANKNNEDLMVFNGSDLIKELNLYAYDPFELPHASSFSFEPQRHWYCFTGKVEEERRHCKTGFWMKKGNVCDVTSGAGNVVLGKKSLFIFYLGNSPTKAIRTDWIMYEYALADTPLAPFVVCRVFDSQPGKDLDSEFGPISDVEGDAAEDKENEVTQNLNGATAADLDEEMEKLAGLINDEEFFIDEMTPEQRQRAIQEDNFIEWDDLA